MSAAAAAAGAVVLCTAGSAAAQGPDRCSRVLNGSAANDVLNGTSGGDRIYGLAGNDILSQCSLATTYQKGASLNEVLTHETGQSRGQAWGGLPPPIPGAVTAARDAAHECSDEGRPRQRANRSPKTCRLDPHPWPRRGGNV